MKMKFKKLLLFILVIIGLNSCKTYTIPVESFKDQFNGIDKESFKKVQLRGTIYGFYMANPIEKIKCIDKNGRTVELVNSPALEIRFTYGKKHKRAGFYFDTIYLADSMVIGQQSRLIPSLTKEIPINSITKIEIQNSGKNERYINH